jgi:hypothetical protein
LFALAASPRFRNIKINYYINKIDSKLEKQFAAVTYQLEEETAYIAYRGTDATVVGWKEDFNMAFTCPVPSQEEGVKYLDRIAVKVPGELRIGGHSKGGNIAVYSAMKCDSPIQERIINVFNHDGPGFKDSIFESPEFIKINNKIHKTLPQSSLIGMLLQDQGKYFVVESNRFGILQHDPFSWSIGTDDFCYTGNISKRAMNMHKTLNQWLSTLTDENRELFIGTLYQVIETTDAATIYEFSEDWRKKAISILGAFKNIDKETKSFVTKTINDLVKLSFKSMHNSSKKP